MESKVMVSIGLPVLLLLVQRNLQFTLLVPVLYEYNLHLMPLPSSKHTGELVLL